MDFSVLPLSSQFLDFLNFPFSFRVSLSVSPSAAKVFRSAVAITLDPFGAWRFCSDCDGPVSLPYVTCLWNDPVLFCGLKGALRFSLWASWSSKNLSFCLPRLFLALASTQRRSELHALAYDHIPFREVGAAVLT